MTRESDINPPVPPADPAKPPRAESFARLFEAVHEGVYIGTIGPRDNVTIAANPYLRIMLGYPPGTPEDALRPFEPDRFTDEGARTVFIDRLARDGAVTDYLLRLRRADEAVIWLEVTANATVLESTGLVRIEALMRDVSDRKQLEDQSRDLYHQLLQAEKMAALGTTISGVAHELNNPLATILTWSERLTERELDASTRRGLDTILHEAERAARIVRNLLTFARKRHTTRTMVDINQVVRETLALRAYEQRVTNISVIDALASGIPAVFADPHQIQQVLLNLVINAEQAMLTSNGRGTLMVRTWQDPDARVDRPRGERRRAGRARGCADEDLRPVFHDEGSGQGDRARPHRGLRHRRGARRADVAGVGAGRRRVVLRGAARGRREAEGDCAR